MRKEKRCFMKKYIKWVLLFVLLLLFVFISVNVYKGTDFYTDGIVYDLVSSNIINDNMTNVVKFITWFGGTIGIVIMCLISLFIIRNKKINVMLVINLICSTLINNYVFKLIFARERPNINPIVIEDGYSFPSGHSMISMMFYGSLIYLAYKYINNKIFKYVVISCLSILIFCFFPAFLVKFPRILQKFYPFYWSEHLLTSLLTGSFFLPFLRK